MSAWVRVGRVGSWTSVVLASDQLEATFLPEMGMLCTSIQADGEQYLALPGGVRAFASGHTTGLPLLHPWANRLGGDRYVACGAEVDLTGSPVLHRDAKGLPIHGTMVGPRTWEITELRAGTKRATLLAAYEYGTEAAELAAFPFPHTVEVDSSVRGRSLRVRTTIRPTTEQKVPVAFGWHPYLRIPGARRSGWTLQLPKRKHIVLDDLGLPTGEVVPEKAEDEPIGRRIFDDGYQMGGRPPWSLSLAAGSKRIMLSLDEGYPVAQVWVPPRKLFASIEPMTARTNGLGAGLTPKVKAGFEFYATFTITITT